MPTVQQHNPWQAGQLQPGQPQTSRAPGLAPTAHTLSLLGCSALLGRLRTCPISTVVCILACHARGRGPIFRCGVANNIALNLSRCLLWSPQFGMTCVMRRHWTTAHTPAPQVRPYPPAPPPPRLPFLTLTKPACADNPSSAAGSDCVQGQLYARRRCWTSTHTRAARLLTSHTPQTCFLILLTEAASAACSFLCSWT
jgi:hypothetical protein